MFSKMDTEAVTLRHSRLMHFKLFTLSSDSSESGAHWARLRSKAILSFCLLPLLQGVDAVILLHPCLLHSLHAVCSLWVLAHLPGAGCYHTASPLCAVNSNFFCLCRLSNVLPFDIALINSFPLTATLFYAKVRDGEQ